MGRPLKIYKPLTLAGSGTLQLLQVQCPLLRCFIFSLCTSLLPSVYVTCTHSAPRSFVSHPQPHHSHEGPSPWFPTFPACVHSSPYVIQSWCRAWAAGTPWCCHLTAPPAQECIFAAWWRADGTVTGDQTSLLCTGEGSALPRLWFLTKVLLSSLYGFTSISPPPPTPPAVWCIFPGYALLFLGCFVVIVACSHWRVPLPLVNGPLPSSCHAVVGPGNCWVLENPPEQGDLCQQQNPLFSEGTLQNRVEQSPAGGMGTEPTGRWGE